jgi:hypothetical protein
LKSTEQFLHSISYFLLSRSRNQALDDEITRLKRSVAEWEKRYRDKEQEYFSYKEKQRSAPEVKLQAKIDMLTLENVKNFFRNEKKKKNQTNFSIVENLE